MSPLDAIKLDPDEDYTGAIFATLADWDEHIQNFFAKPNFQLKAFDDKQQVVPLITTPLLKHCSELSDARRLDLKRSLQYLLTRDEAMPYVDDPRDGALRSKPGSLAQKIRDNCQDTMAPHDGYALCGWMWEILFGAEDWHVDVSQWVLIDSSGGF